MSWKLYTGDVVMVNKAPNGYEYLNGYYLTLTQASLVGGVECWYTEEHADIENCWEFSGLPIPEEWMFKFEEEVDYE